MKDKIIILFKNSTFAGCLLFSATCFAGEEIIFEPKVSSGLENHSNYWKMENQEVSVNTYFTKPGLVFGYETAKTKIALDTTLEAYWYDDQGTLPPGVTTASDDDYLGFAGEFWANHQLTDRLNVGASDEMYVTRDPARADSSNNSITRDKYTINYFEPNVYYEFADKFGIKSKYRNTISDYEKDLEDSTEHRGFFDLYYNLNHTNAVYLDYQLWKRNYDQTTSDYLSSQVSLNYEAKFKYFSVEGWAGYHHRSFEATTLDDINMFPWKIRIKGQDPDSTLKTTKSRMNLDCGQEMNNDGTGDDYFTGTFVRFEGGYRLFNRLDGSMKATFQNSDYATDNRNEDTYLASARLTYQVFDFLAFGIEGGYEKRESNVIGNSYDDTFVLLTLDIDFFPGRKK